MYLSQIRQLLIVVFKLVASNLVIFISQADLCLYKPTSTLASNFYEKGKAESSVKGLEIRKEIKAKIVFQNVVFLQKKSRQHCENSLC